MGLSHCLSHPDGRQPNGPVIVPGDPDASKLWEMVGRARCRPPGRCLPTSRPLCANGLPRAQPKRHAPVTAASAPTTGDGAWYALNNVTLTDIDDPCTTVLPDADYLISSDLIRPLSCGLAPSGDPRQFATATRRAEQSRRRTRPPQRPPNSRSPQRRSLRLHYPCQRQRSRSSTANIQAAAFDLATPSNDDPYLTPVGFSHRAAAGRQQPRHHGHRLCTRWQDVPSARLRPGA